MFNTSTNSGYSLSDIAAVTGNNRNGGCGWGDDGSWWIILIFLFAFGGWGNGFGGNRGIAQGTTTREEISYGFDMNGLENGIRGIQQGLCDGFYAQNSTMLQGFNGLNNSITTGTNAIQNSLCQGFNGINNSILRSLAYGDDNAISFIKLFASLNVGEASVLVFNYVAEYNSLVNDLNRALIIFEFRSLQLCVAIFIITGSDFFCD